MIGTLDKNTLTISESAAHDAYMFVMDYPDYQAIDTLTVTSPVYENQPNSGAIELIGTGIGGGFVGNCLAFTLAKIGVDYVSIGSTLHTFTVNTVGQQAIGGNYADKKSATSWSIKVYGRA